MLLREYLEEHTRDELLSYAKSGKNHLSAYVSKI